MILGLWSLLYVVSLASSKAVITCKDGNICKDLRIVTQKGDEIPAELRRYSRAESIDLHGNLMESFSGSDVGSASQLKALNLSYNLLNSYAQLNFVSHLEEIDITYNQFTYVRIPGSVKKFVAVRNKLVDVTIPGNKMEVLILSKNKLSKIPDISRQINLVELDMSCNEISEVNFNTFSNFRNFRTLNLANNRIYQTAGDRPVNNIQSLDLSHNILTIVDESFNSVSNVQNLNLRSNQIVMITVTNQFRSLRSIDFYKNDWDCKSLTTFMNKLTNIPSLTPERSCLYGNSPHGLCCSQSDAPYADRVIRYNKREYEALQNSSKIREQGVNCDNYQPNPCDGDDNEVYRVANVAANDVQSLLAKDKAGLQSVLETQKQMLQLRENEKNQLDAETNQLQATLNDLVEFIQQTYQEEKLEGLTDSAQQLKAIFQKRDEVNQKTLEDVKGEELKLKNLQQDISRNEEDLQELNDKKDRLIDDIVSRNQTIIEYEKKIKELKIKLGRA